MKITKLEELVDKESWKREIFLHRQMNHENIMKYYDHFELITEDENSYICIVTEYCQVF